MITDKQRQLRRQGIGSSDTVKILHFHPFGDPVEEERKVFWSKVCKTLPPDEPTPEMLGGIAGWLEEGNRQEFIALQWAADVLGVKIITDPEKLFCIAQHGDGAGILLANLDALIEGDSESAIEAKWRNGEQAKAFGESGTDHVAYDVLLQVQHQMYCKDLSKIYVTFATPHYYGVDRRLFIVNRDETIINIIIDEDLAWLEKYVKTETPPDGQNVPPLYILKALKRREGAQIRLSEVESAIADQRTELKQQVKAIDAEIELLDASLINALGDAEIGLLPDSRKVTYKQIESSRFDTFRFKLEHPEIAPAYLTKSYHRTLRIIKK